MPSFKELKYRTFDSLLGEVQIDLQAFNADSTIEPAELIKIAQKCNYQLGLKINQTKQTILDIQHGRAKLPSDFDQLNMALLCDHYTVVTPSIANGIQSRDIVTYNNTANPNITTCPCWTVVSYGAQCDVVHCNGTPETVYFSPNLDGTAKTTKICAISVDTSRVSPSSQLVATTDSFCYNNPDTAAFQCDAPDVCNACSSAPCTCHSVNADPWFQNKVYTLCNNTVGVKVVQECKFETREFIHFEKLYMEPSRDATAFCLNRQFRDCYHKGFIRDGFVWTSNNNCKLYICYQGAMEDDQGNLLVLDHPLINQFYEWSLKVRILQNQYINGEPDLERRLQYAEKELRIARIEAMSITAMPDYKEVVEVIEKRRMNMYNEYVAPFQSTYPDWFYGFY